MYTLVLDEDYCEKYTVSGGIVGEDFGWNCIVDGEDLYYDPIIYFERFTEGYCIRLSNSDDFVKMAQEGTFIFSKDVISEEDFMADIDIGLLFESISKVASELEKVTIKDKEDYYLVKYKDKDIILFGDFGVPLELINNNFNLKNFFMEINTSDICDNCNNILRGSFFTDGYYTFCQDCFDHINYKCAKIGGNDYLADELFLKKI